MKHAEEFAGFVLAGGRSSRMGRDKALLEIDGVRMLDRALDLMRHVGISPAVVGSFGELSREAGVRLIPDDWPGAGPLGGIATALFESRARWSLVMACDMPYLTKEWLEYLLGRAAGSTADAAVPMNERGPEPMCAIYGKNAEPIVRTAVESGIRKVKEGLLRLRIDYIERAEWKGFDSDGLLFKNMNTPADYEDAKARLSGRTTK